MSEQASHTEIDDFWQAFCTIPGFTEGLTKREFATLWRSLSCTQRQAFIDTVLEQQLLSVGNILQDIPLQKKGAHER